MPAGAPALLATTSARAPRQCRATWRPTASERSPGTIEPDAGADADDPVDAALDGRGDQRVALGAEERHDLGRDPGAHGLGG